MCKTSCEFVGRLEPNLHEYNIGHVEDLIRLGFGDLALIFKVTAELNRSNLSMCGGGGLIKTILVAFYFLFLEIFSSPEQKAHR